MASGMGGMRTAGDLVARMQLSKAMKIEEAKAVVAEKLKVSVADLNDPVVMQEVRQDLRMGVITPLAGSAKGIEAKLRMGEVLGIDINCVRRFMEKTSA
jgi:dimethylamine--corrinoid protein Co-methyltransferase